MSDVLYGNLVDEQPLQGRMIDKVIAFEKYDDTEVKAGIAANKAAIESLSAKHDSEMEALEAKHDADQAQNVGNFAVIRDALALANRKVKALIDVLNGKELAFDTQGYNANPVAVPSGAVADTLMKIGGKSAVWNQLYNNSTAVFQKVGSTITKTSDGIRGIFGDYYYVSAYQLASGMEVIPKANHVYYQSYDFVTDYNGESLVKLGAGCQGTGVISPPTQNYDKSKGGFQHFGFVWAVPSAWTGVGGSDYLIWRVLLESAYTSPASTFEMKNMKFIDLTQLFGAGNEPTTVDDPRIKIIKQYAEAHPEYNAGEIISSQTDEVVVRGKNLWNNNAITYGKWTSGSGSVDPNLSAGRMETPINVNSGDIYTLSISGESIPYSASMVFLDGEKFVSREHVTFNNNVMSLSRPVPSGANKMYVQLACSGGQVQLTKEILDTYKFMVERGTTPTPYKPYSLKSIPINAPELRSAGEACDERNYSEGKQHTRIGMLDLGTLAWDAVMVENTRHFTVYNAITSKSQNATCSKYTAVKHDQWAKMGDKEIMIHPTNFAHIHVTDSSYTSAGDFKAAMSGVMLYYELAEEVVTDIDPILELEAITVEAGGEIRFVNHDEAFNMQIPSTHEWVVRNSEV